MAKKEKVNWDNVHIELERQGKFDEFTTPFTEDNLVPIDKDFQYLPNNFGFKLIRTLSSAAVVTLGPLVTLFAFDLRVKGKEKIKALKETGVFSVSSHISFLDSLILKRVYACRKRTYITVAKHNCKKGAGGTILRANGILPLAENLSAVKNFNRAVNTIVDNNDVVHFYAERAMWLHYNKPRPMKKGAFTYASKTKCPIVPLFYEVKPYKGILSMFGLKHRVTCHVLDPIYPKEGLNVKENTSYLQEQTMWALIDKYRECFNVDRDNIYDVDPQYYDSLNEETQLAMSLGRNRQKVDFRLNKDEPTQITE